jgi:uncharacterized membrane protein
VNGLPLLGTIAVSIVWGNPAWSGVVFGILAAFLAILLFGALRSPLFGPLRWGLFALKAVAVTLLAGCLLNPLMTWQHAKPGENIVILLADQSASMAIRQAEDSSESRMDWAKKTLTDPESSWQVRLAQDFDVRRYTFGSSLTRVEGFQGLAAVDPASRLKSALTGIRSRFTGQPLAAIVLFGDGNSTEPVLSEDLDANIPIFPVWNENSRPLPDLSIDSVSISQTNFEDAPVTVQARIAGSGPISKTVRVTLVPLGSSDPAARQSQTVSLSTAGEGNVRFLAKPAGLGPLFYQLFVQSSAEPDVFERPESTREATLQNNRQLLAVNRDTHVSRILYVGGRPNWEHKFLGRALADDELLQLVSLIRIARREARFDFRGRIGESSNPLFRGFREGADEETEAFDQPVLVRLNTRDSKELSNGFPKTRQELYEYEAVILDDIESAFLTHDQQALLDQFVSARGGGLMMLGGRDTFRQGKWDHTPVADILPVYLNQGGAAPVGDLTWQLTRDGWLEPWTRLRETEQAERSRQQAAPPLTVLSNIEHVKPGARVLAEVHDRNGTHSPALVAQQYGRGRSAAVLVGDMWRWSLQESDPPQEDAGKSWRQIMRWLVADVPRRLDATVEVSSDEGNPLAAIRVRVRNREFEPEDEAQVRIAIRQPDGTEVEVDAQPSLREAGLFEASHVSRQPGPYTARISVPGTDHDPQRSIELGWTSDPAAAEFRSADPNLTLLERLADSTRGEVIPGRKLDEFVAKLPNRDLPVMETETLPLWHRPWILLTVLALLAGEWGIRRWKGLA